MLSVKESEKDNIRLTWGEKEGEEIINYYKSFTYDDEEYFLYDCVYVFEKNQTIPHIGKILKMWEDLETQRKAKILWFFHPNEIKNYLGPHEHEDKEIFLASGVGDGLFNIIQLEAICGKCRVVCTSKDERNPQPSDSVREKADFIFFRTFDVGKCTVSRRFPDKIAGIDASFLLNHQKHQKTRPTEHQVRSYNIEDRASKRLNSELAELLDNQLKGKTVTHSKNLRIDNEEKDETDPCKVLTKSPKSSKKCMEEQLLAISLQKSSKTEQKKVKPKFNDLPNESKDPLALNHAVISSDVLFRSACCVIAKDAKIERADHLGSLVLLQNLNPALTSKEIEDVIFKTFSQKCFAMVIQQASFQNPYYGQAFLIFDTRNAAEKLVRRTNDECLVLHGRPVISSIGMLKIPSKKTEFPGHLRTYRRKFYQYNYDMRNAVSTSHLAQPNTIEFSLAVEWVELQARYLQAQNELFKVLYIPSVLLLPIPFNINVQEHRYERTELIDRLKGKKKHDRKKS